MQSFNFANTDNVIAPRTPDPPFSPLRMSLDSNNNSRLHAQGHSEEVTDARWFHCIIRYVAFLLCEEKREYSLCLLPYGLSSRRVNLVRNSPIKAWSMYYIVLSCVQSDMLVQLVFLELSRIKDHSSLNRQELSQIS